jgi:hypothetical protein
VASAFASLNDSTVADIADLTGIQGGRHGIADEARLALQGLPHVAVEALPCCPPDDLDFGVEVALPDDAAFALGDVRGPPRGVQMVEGDGAVLDVGADAHLLGRADQHGDVPGPAGGEEPREFGVVLGFVDEPDRLTR